METTNVQIIKATVFLAMIGYFLVLSYSMLKLPLMRKYILKDQSHWIIWVGLNIPFIVVTSFFEWQLFLSKEIIALWIYSSLCYISFVVLFSLYGKFYYFWKVRK